MALGRLSSDSSRKTEPSRPGRETAEAEFTARSSRPVEAAPAPLLVLQFASRSDHNARAVLWLQPRDERDHLLLCHGYGPGGRTFPVSVNENRGTAAGLLAEL